MKTNMNRWVALMVMSVMGLTGAHAQTDHAENRLPNPSFEAAERNRPVGWRSQRWSGQATFGHDTIGRTGDRSARIASEEGGDASWTVTVPVEPFGRYRLSGWIRTENVRTEGGRGALLNVHTLAGAATRALTGENDWTRVDVEFDVEDQDAVQVNALLGGWGNATGAAWFDDVRLELVSQREVPTPRIVVHAGDVGEPMSERIYGQFIEHLGRCIYGGIWAEMLEDRKFHFPITAEYNPYRALRDSAFPVVGASPWQIMGDPNRVSMRGDDPFVGRHTPLIGSDSGVRQRDLGVDQGKTYVGYAWLKSAGGTPATVEVSLVWGLGTGNRSTVRLAGIRDEYRRFQFEMVAGATTDQAMLELRNLGGPVLVGTISLMPGDHVEGMRADTLQLLRELNSPIYRWPGGNFVSGYDWRDGIGDRDRRPPRTNPAWTGLEHNDFGMHEFIRFCELVGAEPSIVVNTGFGDAHSAAAQLEYANGAPDTHWGARRLANGRVKPFGVRYWGIGNEMWGDWQLGYMRLEHYVLKHNWVVDTMRLVDPDIVSIASGQAGSWSLGLLRNCADHIDYIAEHFYCQERPGLAAHVRQIPDNIRGKAEFHRQARRDIPGLTEKDIRIAMTEWNYWYGPHLFGELGTRYFLKDALGIAAGVHEYARQSDIIESAYYAQTVNVIGAIKTSRRNAAFATTGLVLKLYRQQFGEHPVRTESSGLIDAQAAWSDDRKRLTLGIVNPTLKPVTIPLETHGARLAGTGTRWQIADPDPMVYNDPDQSPRVIIEEQGITGLVNQVTVPACSVTLLVLDVE
jgi:alpha-N-arabinofuranosidase